MKALKRVKINNLNACGTFGHKSYVMEINFPKDSVVMPYMKALEIQMKDTPDNRVWAYGCMLDYKCEDGKMVASINPEDIVEMVYEDIDPDIVDTEI